MQSLEANESLEKKVVQWSPVEEVDGTGGEGTQIGLWALVKV